jgi:hypothetical protein
VILFGAIAIADMRDDVVYIKTTPCVVCGKTHEYYVNRREYEDWQYGKMKIQQVFPELTLDEKETLISGTCGSCFDEMFKEDDN